MKWQGTGFANTDVGEVLVSVVVDDDDNNNNNNNSSPTVVETLYGYDGTSYQSAWKTANVNIGTLST